MQALHAKHAYGTYVSQTCSAMNTNYSWDEINQQTGSQIDIQNQSLHNMTQTFKMEVPPMLNASERKPRSSYNQERLKSITRAYSNKL